MVGRPELHVPHDHRFVRAVLVWIIANLMRFVLGIEVNATFKLPGAEDVSVSIGEPLQTISSPAQTLEVAVL